MNYSNIFNVLNVFRCYRDSAERYEVALICLKLFDKFLKHYTPKLSDFPKRGRLHTNSPPGYHLMVQFNNKTEALSLILELLDEGIQMFESYVPFHGQEILQKCTYTCLTIILKTLSLQPKFVGSVLTHFCLDLVLFLKLQSFGKYFI